jgi:cell division septum initiation protein DivIVA
VNILETIIADYQQYSDDYDALLPKIAAMRERLQEADKDLAELWLEVGHTNAGIKAMMAQLAERQEQERVEDSSGEEWKTGAAKLGKQK